MKNRTGFMDLVDYQHELGSIPVTIYPSIEVLKHHSPCVEECGIIKVKIIGVEVVQEQNFTEYGV